jgi:hypothetical protein
MDAYEEYLPEALANRPWPTDNTFLLDIFTRYIHEFEDVTDFVPCFVENYESMLSHVLALQDGDTRDSIEYRAEELLWNIYCKIAPNWSALFNQSLT